MREVWNEKLLFNWYRVSVWDDQNIWEMDSGDVNVNNVIQLYT